MMHNIMETEVWRHYLQCPECSIETTALFDKADKRDVKCDNCGQYLNKMEHSVGAELIKREMF